MTGKTKQGNIFNCLLNRNEPTNDVVQTSKDAQCCRINRTELFIRNTKQTHMSYTRTHYYELSILLRVSAYNFAILRESKHTVENLLQIQQITIAIITACNNLQVASQFKVTDKTQTKV